MRSAIIEWLTGRQRTDADYIRAIRRPGRLRRWIRRLRVMAALLGTGVFVGASILAQRPGWPWPGQNASASSLGWVAFFGGVMYAWLFAIAVLAVGTALRVAAMNQATALLLRLHDILNARGNLPPDSSGELEPTAPPAGWYARARAGLRVCTGSSCPDEKFVARVRESGRVRQLGRRILLGCSAVYAVLAVGLAVHFREHLVAHLTEACAGLAVGMIGGALWTFAQFPWPPSSAMAAGTQRVNRLILRYYDCLAEQDALPADLCPPSISQ